MWWKCVTHLTSQLLNITIWFTKWHSFNESLFDASHGSLKWRCCGFHCHLRLHRSCWLFNNNAAAGFIHFRFTKWVHIVVHTLNHYLGHSLGHTMVASIVWFLFMCKQIAQYLYLCGNVVCVWWVMCCVMCCVLSCVVCVSGRRRMSPRVSFSRNNGFV